MLGWLGRDHFLYGWGNIFGSRSSQYQANYVEGFPATPPTEPDVVCQFLFDEASGNIVDEVAAITLSASGSPTYSQTATGLLSGISPGILYGTSKEHRKITATASLDITGAQNFVMEAWFTITSSAGVQYLWSYNQTNSTDFGILNYIQNGTSLILDLRTSDATQVTCTWSITDLNDAAIHKMRITGIRTGNTTLFIDGTSKGTVSISSLNGKTFTNAGLRMAGQYNNGGANLIGVLYTFRLTVGNATNNSGGVNGG